MNTTFRTYLEASAPLEEVLDAVAPGRWSAASPCAGWTARDVLGHLIATQRDFFTGRGHDVGVAPGIEADPVAAWREHARMITALLRDDAVVAAGYDGFFGPTTTGETFETFYVWDMLVHRWDIAMAGGTDANLTAEEIDRIDRGAAAFGEGLYMEGVCRPGVEAGPGDDGLAQVLAKLGRRV
ncbi:MAG: maleylpyruvate isomerase family mycothiol-dependent enzyme [Arachnia sp.]